MLLGRCVQTDDVTNLDPVRFEGEAHDRAGDTGAKSADIHSNVHTLGGNKNRSGVTQSGNSPETNALVTKEYRNA